VAYSAYPAKDPVNGNQLLQQQAVTITDVSLVVIDVPFSLLAHQRERRESSSSGSSSTPLLRQQQHQHRELAATPALVVSYSVAFNAPALGLYSADNAFAVLSSNLQASVSGGGAFPQSSAFSTTLG